MPIKNRIVKLIKDWKFCREHKSGDRYIKWRIKCEHKDIPACSFFIIPTIVYNPTIYLSPGYFIINVYFLHWYIGIGEWCNKESSDE